MPEVTLYGAPYSVYLRIARLTLEEAATPYDLVEVDIFDRQAWPADYAARHPFGKIPAFEHAGFRLYETDAIAFYVAEALGGDALIPDTPQARARMRQVMRICDNYAYPRLVWGLYVAERENDGPADAAAATAAADTLDVLCGLLPGPCFGGGQPSLADLWVLPMLSYLRLSATGQALLTERPSLIAWLDRLQSRGSVRRTRFPSEAE